MELFKIGEYYFKVEKVDQALHAFKKYIEFYPDSKYASIANERLNRIKSGNVGGGGGDFSPSFEAAPARNVVESSDDLTDFSIDDEAAPSSSPTSSTAQASGADTGARSPLAGEMDDFLSDSKSDDLLDDFSFDEPAVAVPPPRHRTSMKYFMRPCVSFPPGNTMKRSSFMKK